MKNGKTKRNRSIKIVCLLAFVMFHLFPVQSIREAELSWGQTDSPKEIALEMAVGKDRVFSGERVSLTVTLISYGQVLKDIQYPVISTTHFALGEWEHPAQRRMSDEGHFRETLTFRTTLEAKRPGEFKIGPGRIRLLLVSAGSDPSLRPNRGEAFFGTPEQEQITLTSNQVSLYVWPYPEKGKPRDFSGAVGTFKMDLEIQPREVGPGEPVALKAFIRGSNGLDTFGPPILTEGKGFRIEGPRKRNTGDGVLFEWALLAESDQVTRSPGLVFHFFDPDKGIYQTLFGEAVSLKIRRSVKEPILWGSSAGSESKLEILPLKKYPGHLKKQGQALYQNRLFVFLQVIPLLFLIFIGILRQRREKLKNDPNYARRLEAAREAKKGMREAEKRLAREEIPEFYAGVFKNLQHCLGLKGSPPPEGLTGAELIACSQTQEIDEPLRGQIRELFHRCAAGRFSSHPLDRNGAEDTLNLFRAVLKGLERAGW